MTAAVYMRGLLQHEYGVKPSDIEWVQGRADRLGRKLPPDIRLRQAPSGTRARRPARARRDRLHDDRQQSALVPPRLAEGEKVVPQLRRGREGLLPPHQDLSHHAYGGDPPRRPRAQSLGRAQHVQGAVPREGAGLSPAGGHGLAQGLIGLAAAADRGGEIDHRTRLVSLRDRSQSALDRGTAAIHPRARAHRPPCEAGRAVRAEHAARHTAQRGPACSIREKRQ